MVPTGTVDADYGDPDGAFNEIRHRMVLWFAQERDSGCWKAPEDVCPELLKVGSVPKRDTRGYAETRSARGFEKSLRCLRESAHRREFEPGSEADGRVLLLLQTHVTRRRALLDTHTTFTSIGAGNSHWDMNVHNSPVTHGQVS